MQTYLVSHLLRTNVGRVGLILSLFLINPCAWAADVPLSNTIEKDSLFSRWMKSKQTLPTLIYRLGDFNDLHDRVEVESMIRTYGIGGVIVPNGDQEEVKQWISQNQKRRTEPLLHIVEITNIFELPFDNLQVFPGRFSIECLTDEDLVFKLGLAHADHLRKMGIGLIQFSELPNYYTNHEIKKVVNYLNGLSAGNISHYLTGQNPIGLANGVGTGIQMTIQIVDVNKVAENGILAKKTFKNYRKKNNDGQILIDQSRQIETTIAQIERGAGLITVSKESKPQELINALLLKDIQNKGSFKRHVKDYYQLLNHVEMQLKMPTDEATSWENVSRKFSNTDITLVQDKNHLVPIINLENKKILTISDNKAVFELTVDKYKTATHLPLSVLDSPIDSLFTMLPSEAIILIDLTSFENEADFIQAQSICDSLNTRSPIITFYSQNGSFINNSQFTTLIWSPEISSKNLAVMVEMTFGARPIIGALPGYLQNNGSRKGIFRKAINRLTYLSDDELTVDDKVLSRIDSLVEGAIAEKAMPGCQIMMVKDGKVVYDKSFGYLTYDSLSSVRWDHLYDVASLTKTVATVPAVMERMSEGKISLQSHLGDYLSAYHSTDNTNLTIENILTHQSGLKSYIPFWRYAKYAADSAVFLYKKKKWRRKYSYHSINWNDSIQSWIADSKYNSLSNNDGSYRYLYSDLGFMVMKEVVEDDCTCHFDQSVRELIYKPLGMDYTTFNPLERFQSTQIAPTEQDIGFRSTLLQGVVHDKNAALLGGVSGHAGLFSNANDLAKYMQMLLQNGYYGGVQFFPDSIVQVFTSKKNLDDRRALGWDKPDFSVGNASRYASERSFGHSGFTGTLIWADPEYDLIYIFLSNRIYPDPQNYKLIESNTRTKIHDLMYESFLKSGKEANQGI
ncbi:MAG: serine hydrolase [Reichenbachiella sp.]|uniref:serine hydrolase domain-containing protein n=2 Tax=Reichenbachiella sp. TaxID=2184521 RepID=UPI0032648120